MNCHLKILFHRCLYKDDAVKYAIILAFINIEYGFQLVFCSLEM